MAHYIYPSYTEYLYDMSMDMWYAGATFQPLNPELVELSTVVYARSQKAAKAEQVLHPDECNTYVDCNEADDCEIPF
jgi:hypothetical protein